MPIETEQINDVYSKPAFDGRLHYYKLVGDYMIAIAQAQNTKNYTQWITYINGLFDLVKPFIQQAEVIKKSIKNCEKQINALGNFSTNASNQFILNKHLEQKLHNLTQDIYTAAKSMLLPISEQSDDVFDEADFLAKSDL